MNFCPVPEEQQPLNEFKELQSSWFFSWALASWRSFLWPVFAIWGSAWLIAAPVTAISFPPHQFFGHFILMVAASATIPLWIVLIQLYFGWRYVCDRLQQETIFYEESGWFDGQLWRKPADILVRDRLIVTYQLKPCLQRLERVFLGLILLLGLTTILWNWV